MPSPPAIYPYYVLCLLMILISAYLGVQGSLPYCLGLVETSDVLCMLRVLFQASFGDWLLVQEMGAEIQIADEWTYYVQEKDSLLVLDELGI